MIFLKLEYAGQNEIDGLNPKIFWVIFFQPLLLDLKHGERSFRGHLRVMKGSSLKPGSQSWIFKILFVYN